MSEAGITLSRMAFIEARGVVKRYQVRKAPPVEALAGLDLSVERGTVRALLGPNGAGKTTAVKVFTTLLPPDEGTATIGGLDVVQQGSEIRPIIGVSGQYAAVDENLTGFENLDMVGRLYHFRPAESRRRARELIEVFELTEAQNRPVKGFSGGMRRRIDLAGALVIRPKVLFLDEPTTGLDPRSRIGMWDIITKLVSDGTTVLLTTQYLEEADQLADDIVVMNHGRIIAQGTPLELKQQAGNASLVVTVSHATDLPAARELIARTGSEVHVDVGARQLTAAADGIAVLTRVADWLQERAIEVDDIGLSRPSLDDVFLSLTGRRAAGDDVEEVGA